MEQYTSPTYKGQQTEKRITFNKKWSSDGREWSVWLLHSLRLCANIGDSSYTLLVLKHTSQFFPRCVDKQKNHVKTQTSTPKAGIFLRHRLNLNTPGYDKKYFENLLYFHFKYGIERELMLREAYFTNWINSCLLHLSVV